MSDSRKIARRDPSAKARETKRLKAGWRRYLEIVERVRRERTGEATIRLDPPEFA